MIDFRGVILNFQREVVAFCSLTRVGFNPLVNKLLAIQKGLFFMKTCDVICSLPISCSEGSHDINIAISITYIACDIQRCVDRAQPQSFLLCPTKKKQIS